MDYYNNEALEVILKYEKSTNKNTVTLNESQHTLNNNQKHTNKNLVEFINVFKKFIDDLKEENKLIREDLKQIKSVFNLDKESTKDKVISSPPKEYQKMIDLLSKPINFIKIYKHPKYGAMQRCGSYNTIADLIKSSKQEILSIRSVGKNTYSIIVEKLAKHNLYIGMDISKYEPYLKLKQ
tara:strand:+ start:591 stop:1133 length:543 start_codon:yes stop_codon:yes gene_type:complete